MKCVVETVDGEGLESLLGKRVFLMTGSYFYVGKLVGVNTDCVKLEQPSIVYDTGSWETPGWTNEESLPMRVLYVTRQSLEAFAEAPW